MVETHKFFPSLKTTELTTSLIGGAKSKKSQLRDLHNNLPIEATSFIESFISTLRTNMADLKVVAKKEMTSLRRVSVYHQPNEPRLTAVTRKLSMAVSQRKVSTMTNDGLMAV